MISLSELALQQRGDIVRTYERLAGFQTGYVPEVSSRFYQVLLHEGNSGSPAETQITNLPIEKCQIVIGITNGGSVVCAFTPSTVTAERLFTACETGLFKAEGPEDMEAYFYGQFTPSIDGKAGILDIFKLTMPNTYASTLTESERYLNRKIAEKLLSAFKVSSVRVKRLSAFSV